MLVKFNPIGPLLTRSPFFEDFFNTDLKGRNGIFAPDVDIRESEKEFVVQAELPGLDKKDFSLKLENNILTLSGEKKYENEDKREGGYRLERRYGAFKRSFRLTDSVDASKIKADYRNGVLTINVPKAAKAKAKEVEISVK